MAVKIIELQAQTAVLVCIAQLDQVNGEWFELVNDAFARLIGAKDFGVLDGSKCAVAGLAAENKKGFFRVAHGDAAELEGDGLAHVCLELLGADDKAAPFLPSRGQGRGRGRVVAELQRVALAVAQHNLGDGAGGGANKALPGQVIAFLFAIVHIKSEDLSDAKLIVDGEGARPLWVQVVIHSLCLGDGRGPCPIVFVTQLDDAKGVALALGVAGLHVGQALGLEVQGDARFVCTRVGRRVIGPGPAAQRGAQRLAAGHGPGGAKGRAQGERGVAAAPRARGDDSDRDLEPNRNVGVAWVGEARL